MALEFKLPELGEGLSEGELVAWKVKEGEDVKGDQPLAAVLTDKAEVEIPSPRSGKVLKLVAKPGEKVHVGALFAVIGDAGESWSGPAAAKPSGDGKAAAAAAPAQAAASGGGVQAAPAVRKLASELGVALESVKGTGPGGRITEDDVRKAKGGAAKPAAPKAAPGGPEERAPFTGIRRRTAEKMAESHRIIPQVTHVDEADVTELVKLRAELKGEAEKRGVKLTYLGFIIKAVTKALREFPAFNASLDEEAGEAVYKKYYNVGIAIDTPHGLFNPVLRDADKKDVWQAAAEIEKIAAKARDNKLEVADLTGGTFTITNIGPIGGTYATPIVVHPEAAILGVMKIRKAPRVVDNEVHVRDVINLCLSFDHRLADGAEAARFTNSVVKALENPRTLLS